MKTTTVSPSEYSYTKGDGCHGVYQLFKIHNHFFYCTHSSLYAYAIGGFPHTTEDYGKMTNRDAHTKKHARTHTHTNTSPAPFHSFTFFYSELNKAPESQLHIFIYCMISIH